MNPLETWAHEYDVARLRLKTRRAEVARELAALEEELLQPVREEAARLIFTGLHTRRELELAAGITNNSQAWKKMWGDNPPLKRGRRIAEVPLPEPTEDTPEGIPNFDEAF